MIVGLLGALINNENLGCVALTYSLINLLERISKKHKITFDYYVFEVEPDSSKLSRITEKLGLERSRIHVYDVTPLFRIRRFIHHFSTGIISIKALRKCDLCIDLTGGDSFTDIYGQYTFDAETNVKLLIEKMGIPLILGPQTYGPFTLKKNITKAIKAIDGASMVMSRDQKSADYIHLFSEKEIDVTTDLAFEMPYEHNVTKSEKGVIKVGINVSGLLLNDKTESTTLSLQLKTDYDKFVCGVIDSLIEDGHYEIYCIPHVGTDGTDWIERRYGSRVNCLKPFEDPISAKSFIADMDVFIGSRMHATIGAFSTGVATIPVAYSRKFSGLYERIGYPYIVDLQTMPTEDAINITLYYTRKYDCLKKSVRECMQNVSTISRKNMSLLENAILKQTTKIK